MLKLNETIGGRRAQAVERVRSACRSPPARPLGVRETEMSSLEDSEAYIVVPRSVSEDDLAALSQKFAETPGLRVVRWDRVSGFQLAGPEPAGITEFAHWMVNFGPDLFHALAQDFLLAYAGKKLIDTVVGEAGKDLWKAVKSLFTSISSRPRRDSEVMEKGASVVALRAVGRPMNQGGYLDIYFEFDVPETKVRLNLDVEQFETCVLPLMACLISSSAEPLHLRIYLNSDHEGPWHIWDLGCNRSIRIAPERRRYWSYDASGSSQVPVVRMESCLRTLGLEQALPSAHNPRG